MDDGGCGHRHLGPIKGPARKRLIRAGISCGGRGFQITEKPVESVTGASEKPAINCQPRFVTAVGAYDADASAEGEKGALRASPRKSALCALQISLF